jgi:hypothetical protein
VKKPGIDMVKIDMASPLAASLKTPRDLACSMVVFSFFSFSHSNSKFSEDLASFGFLSSIILKHAF